MRGVQDPVCGVLKNDVCDDVSSTLTELKMLCVVDQAMFGTFSTAVDLSNAQVLKAKMAL